MVPFEVGIDCRGVSLPLAVATVKGLIAESVRRAGGRAAPKVNVERLEKISSEGVSTLALSW